MGSSCAPSTSGATWPKGCPRAQLREALAGLDPVNLGALADVERWRPDEHAAMLEEARDLTDLAVEIGASFVQLLTGPVAPGRRLHADRASSRRRSFAG